MKTWRENRQQWIDSINLNPLLRSELESVQDEKQLEDRFYRKLEFGTGGMRGVMGAGTNRMNIYTVRRVTTALASYLLKNNKDAKEQGVVIAYDSRHMSFEFAEEAACVLAYHGVRSFVFEELCPTPVLSFGVRHLQAAAGIVITASHNPPEYNGYKVYGPNGAQFLPTEANHILREMEQIENELLLPVSTKESAVEKGLIQSIGSEVHEAYEKQVFWMLGHQEGDKRIANDLQIVYTPLHGTGNRPVRKILQKLGYHNVHIVPEQEHPDPNFSTVISPNPEERQAFSLALALAQQVNADLIIGTDPDADRVGLVTKTADGEFVLLNGNQTGALLLQYLLEKKAEQGQLPAKGAMVKTIVTSDLGRVICDRYDVHTVDTLTGFKYIAQKISEYEQTGDYKFLFGYEESNGYLSGDFVRDKDAIQTTALCCEMAAFYKYQGMTLHDVLQTIYQTYGYYSESLVSFTFKGIDGGEKISSLMQRLREHSVKELAGLRVVETKDYQNGMEGLPKENVLKFFFKDGSWLAIRPSGTEPKIKFYVSVRGSTESEAKEKQTLLEFYVTDMVHQFEMNPTMAWSL